MVDLVSVVIPTRNRCARLLDAIESAREQTGVEVEIIVVDDASTDDTPLAMTALCEKEPRLLYVRNERPLGGGGARNAGADLAKGEFIAFLDDDDRFLPSKLARQVGILRSQPNASSASCSFWLYNGERQSSMIKISPPRDRAELLHANMLGGASVCMVRSKSFHDAGGFDPRLPSCQDWDLWLKLHALGPIAVCDEPLVRYNLHSGSQITGNAKAEYRGRRRVHLRYRKEMSTVLRRGSLAALTYYRRVRFGTTTVQRIAGLLQVTRLAPGYERIGYLWRTLKLLRRGELTQGRK